MYSKTDALVKALMLSTAWKEPQLLNEPLEWDFRMEDAQGFSVTTSSHTVSLMILCKASTSKDADFTSEADVSEEPSSDIDNKSMHAAHKQ